MPRADAQNGAVCGASLAQLQQVSSNSTQGGSPACWLVTCRCLRKPALLSLATLEIVLKIYARWQCRLCATSYLPMQFSQSRIILIVLTISAGWQCCWINFDNFFLYKEIGIASLGASEEDISKLVSCYFFTVEFGICRYKPKLFKNHSVNPDWSIISV